MSEKLAGYPEKLLCPCKVCRNLSHQCINILYEHLVIYGIDPTYKIWFHHGEELSRDDDVETMETFDSYNLFRATNIDGCDFESHLEGHDDTFMEKIEDADTPLYPQCTKYTKLSSIVALYKVKTTNGWSDKSFDELLRLLNDMFPLDNMIPKSMYEVRKFLRLFDLGYEKIHACVNDCCLFRKDKENLQECPTCGTSRWMSDKLTKKVRHGVPAKVLRYFPIIPRLKRMFMSKRISKELRWHHNNKSCDGKMRHPVDSAAWELVNDKWPSFSNEERNIRLGLSTDGFNPFSNLSSKYSVWPVLLVMYNLPPWLKQENILLSMLIPRPKQPGNDIDIYLEPLVEDLKLLWNEGVDAHDALDNTNFKLRAILMWTIQDFPAYGNLADVAEKSKNGLKARLDLQHMGIRSALHPQEKGTRTYLPAALHTLSKLEKELFCKRLFSLKVPDGYSSNIRNCVSMEQCKLMGLKSHDCHILMQQLLPVAIKGLMPLGPRDAIIRLCTFFNRICQRVLDRESIMTLENDVIETLCLLERFFPPSFFDVMIHLVVHIGRETRLCGPVQFRWIRMKILKDYVRNRARPEGCITECYLADECVSFCNEFTDHSIELNTKEGRNEEWSNDVILEGRPISRRKEIILTDELLEIAHRYILLNTSVVEPFLE
ncbi:uncharacterized protein LOC133792584 [Humulus lupulus]|uniref:uncharacterized protein LOC133792584 n=1 Tax=Humulus lupulus TaxID=3486 RepID=UPI002B4018A8|nr:uncharacterized protein LOC133792584 [Humulus lupulus]